MTPVFPSKGCHFRLCDPIVAFEKDEMVVVRFPVVANSDRANFPRTSAGKQLSSAVQLDRLQDLP